jgi:heme/copper-type cytochrome/quinol oxidase subunit 3
VAAEIMTQSYETGKAIAELGAKQPHELLLMLGGVLTILLSAATYGIRWATTGIPQAEYTKVATTVILNLVFGGAFWAAAAMTRKNLMNGALTAGVVGIMLIYYGGQPGTIGGLVGILGAIVAVAKFYIPSSRRR